MIRCNAIVDLLWNAQAIRNVGSCVLDDSDHLCGKRAYLRFRHPTILKGHYRCMQHRDEDKKTFDNFGWIEEGIPLADTL